MTDPITIDEARRLGLCPITTPYSGNEQPMLERVIAHLRESGIKFALVAERKGLALWRSTMRTFQPIGQRRIKRQLNERCDCGRPAANLTATGTRCQVCLGIEARLEADYHAKPRITYLTKYMVDFRTGVPW